LLPRLVPLELIAAVDAVPRDQVGTATSCAHVSGRKIAA